MRRAADLYKTPAWQTRALLAHQPIDGLILEPCAGDGSIARVFPRPIICNDRIESHGTPYIFDARDPALYDQVEQDCGAPIDWVVTNPPYSMPMCRDIVELAVERARVGVAMLLRISFMEPTSRFSPRGPFLAAHPPKRVLTLPRHSYTDNGHSDTVTTQWVIWAIDEAVAGLAPILALYNAHRTYSDAAFAVAS